MSQVQIRAGSTTAQLLTKMGVNVSTPKPYWQLWLYLLFGVAWLTAMAVCAAIAGWKVLKLSAEAVMTVLEKCVIESCPNPPPILELQIVVVVVGFLTLALALLASFLIWVDKEL